MPIFLATRAHSEHNLCQLLMNINHQNHQRACSPPPEPVLEDYGEAIFVPGRNKKHPTLMYKSRHYPNRLYEWCLGRSFTKPIGYSTWMCTHCSVLKQRQRKLGVSIVNKIPRILVDNGIVRENPDFPANPHFCTGKNVIEATTSRIRLQACQVSIGKPSVNVGLVETPIYNNFLLPEEQVSVKRLLMRRNKDGVAVKRKFAVRDPHSEGEDQQPPKVACSLSSREASTSYRTVVVEEVIDELGLRYVEVTDSNDLEAPDMDVRESNRRKGLLSTDDLSPPSRPSSLRHSERIRAKSSKAEVKFRRNGIESDAEEEINVEDI